MRLRIGVSSCLLGQHVRYDGGHKRQDDLAAWDVEWVPVCPEVEVGMGTPREPIRIERRPDGLHLVAPGSGTDHTESMRAWAARRVERLASMGLDGYVVKARSPSCGLGDAPVGGGEFADGFFTAALRERLPDLPVATEEDLDAPDARTAFLARCATAGAKPKRRGTG